MRAKPYGYKRKNQAFRVAYWPDCQRIHTSPNLFNVSHGWARAQLDDLSAPALKVLRFLAALNLTGKTGYIGFAVAYKLLAPLISDSSSEKFKRRSMERGIHDLKEAGLIEVHPWLQEAQFFRAGGRNVKMSGAGTVKLENGAVVVRRLAIVTLTELALAMWELGKGKPPADNVRRMAKSAPDPSPAKLAVSSPETEQIDKSIMLGLDSNLVSSSVSTTDLRQGRPTSPTEPRTAQPSVEHGVSKAERQSKSGPSSASSLPTASIEAPFLDRDGVKNHAKGCTKPRPGNRGPCDRGSAAIARDMILSGLWDMLANHSPRQADALFARAKWEIDQKGPARWPSTVDWSYWLEKWTTLTPPDRRLKILQQILPLLKSKPVTPHDKKKVLPPAPAPKNREPQKLNHFLEGIVNRFGLEIPPGLK